MDVVAGEMARTLWAMAHARLPDCSQPVPPTTTKFTQIQHLEVMLAAFTRTDRESDFRAVTVRINGSTDLQLSVNICELRGALALPPYSLVADGLFSQFFSPAEPAEDADSVDHTRSTALHVLAARAL